MRFEAYVKPARILTVILVLLVLFLSSKKLISDPSPAKGDLGVYLHAARQMFAGENIYSTPAAGIQTGIVIQCLPNCPVVSLFQRCNSIRTQRPTVFIDDISVISRRDPSCWLDCKIRSRRNFRILLVSIPKWHKNSLEGCNCSFISVDAATFPNCPKKLFRFPASRIHLCRIGMVLPETQGPMGPRLYSRVIFDRVRNDRRNMGKFHGRFFYRGRMYYLWNSPARRRYISGCEDFERGERRYFKMTPCCHNRRR